MKWSIITSCQLWISASIPLFVAYVVAILQIPILLAQTPLVCVSCLHISSSFVEHAVNDILIVIELHLYQLILLP